jgi:hypothetical protein
MRGLGSLAASTLPLLLLGIAVPANAQALRQQLVGTWTFVSSTTKLPDGSPHGASIRKGC